MKKRILLLAYTNTNFGDDLFIRTICDYFPTYQFVLEAPKEYKGYFSAISNLQILNSRGFWNRAERKITRALYKLASKDKCNQLNPRLNQYAAVVYVIGGLFDEDDIWYSMVEQYGLPKLKQIMWQNSLCGDVPFFLLGCNMTRIKTQDYINQMQYLFEGITDICFRDRYSYDYFSELKNVRYAPDIVFNYRCGTHKKPGSDLILISVWGALTQCQKLPQWKWAEDKFDAYADFLVDAVHFFLSRKQSVCLLSLCEEEGDLEACHRIVSKGGFADMVTVRSYQGDIDTTVTLFENAKFVVGTRFHSVIMALNTNTPFYPIVYESKTAQLLKDLNYEGHQSHIQQPESYQIDNLIAQYERSEVIDCTEVKEQAKAQFAELESHLLQTFSRKGKDR